MSKQDLNDAIRKLIKSELADDVSVSEARAVLGEIDDDLREMEESRYDVWLLRFRSR